jgi:hypothetical protein
MRSMEDRGSDSREGHHGCSLLLPTLPNTGVCLIPRLETIRYQSPADNLRLGQQHEKRQESGVGPVFTVPLFTASRYRNGRDSPCVRKCRVRLYHKSTQSCKARGRGIAAQYGSASDDKRPSQPQNISRRTLQSFSIVSLTIQPLACRLNCMAVPVCIGLLRPRQHLRFLSRLPTSVTRWPRYCDSES